MADGKLTPHTFPDFSPTQWRILNNFMSYSDEGHRSRFAHELASYKVSFHFANSGVISNIGTLPEDETLCAFLHKYRPILLRSEPTSFMNVCSLIDRHVNFKPFSAYLKHLKAQYTGKALNDVFSLKQADMSLLGETFLDTYLNAFEYHRDERHKERLAPFLETFEPDARKGLVTLLLTFKFCAVSGVREFVDGLITQRAQMTNSEKTLSPTTEGHTPQKQRAIGFRYISGVVDKAVLDQIASRLSEQDISFKSYDMSGQPQASIDDLLSSFVLFVSSDITNAYMLGLLTNATYDVLRTSLLMLWKAITGKKVTQVSAGGSREQPVTIDLNMIIGNDSLTFKLDGDVSEEVQRVLIDRIFDFLKSHRESKQPQHLILFTDKTKTAWNPVPFETLIQREFEKHNKASL